MPAIADAVRELLHADCPVLFLDTCVLLDVIRSIERRLQNCTTAANELLLALTGPTPRFRLVVSHLVHHEWQSHANQLRLDADRHLGRLEEMSGHFHESCAVFGITTGFDRATYSRWDVATRLHDLSQKVLQSGLTVDSDNGCFAKAMYRVIHNIPPSKRGGEAKDCTILEEYLAVCGALRAGGFQKKLVYCTSNTNDYCDKSSVPATALATEFATLALDFRTSLEWAVHELSN